MRDCVRISAEQHGSSDNPTGTFFDGTFEELGQALITFWWRKREPDQRGHGAAVQQRDRRGVDPSS
jgi:hypothetical protein